MNPSETKQTLDTIASLEDKLLTANRSLIKESIFFDISHNYFLIPSDYNTNYRQFRCYCIQFSHNYKYVGELHCSNCNWADYRSLSNLDCISAEKSKLILSKIVHSYKDIIYNHQ